MNYSEDNEKQTFDDIHLNETSNLPRVPIAVISLLIVVSITIFAYTGKTKYSERNFELTDFTYYVYTDEYGVNTAEMFEYPFLEDSLLLEPYKNNIIDVGQVTSGCILEWTFNTYVDHNVVSTGSSSDGTIVIYPRDIGRFVLDIYIKCNDNDDEEVSTSKNIWVKYIRRELTSLTESDRELFLDALHTLWIVNATQGKLLYGPEYKSIYYFAALHNDAGGNFVCDEFHGGSGQ